MAKTSSTYVSLLLSNILFYTVYIKLPILYLQTKLFMHNGYKGDSKATARAISPTAIFLKSQRKEMKKPEGNFWIKN